MNPTDCWSNALNASRNLREITLVDVICFGVTGVAWVSADEGFETVGSNG